jgi:hypothetical protein
LGLHEILSAAGLYNIFYSYSSLRPLAGGENPRPASIADPADPNDYAGERDLLEFFAPSLVVSNVVGCMAGAVSGLILATEGWGWEALFTAQLVGILINFVANLIAVISVKPPMPKVVISRDEADGSEPIRGYQLAHSEGLWYIFDDKYKILQTIRDDRAVVDVLYP